MTRTHVFARPLMGSGDHRIARPASGGWKQTALRTHRREPHRELYITSAQLKYLMFVFIPFLEKYAREPRLLKEAADEKSLIRKVCLVTRCNKSLLVVWL